jgi:hypothetical protein
MRFRRDQLVDRDYDPLADPDGPDRQEMEERYDRAGQEGSLDHAAAVRGILVRENAAWKWIWDWGLLHDEMVRKYGFDRLYARYRNQCTFVPVIQFEIPVEAAPLRLLLEECPILPDDVIQITGWRGFRAFSIRDALIQLGEPLEG